MAIIWGAILAIALGPYLFFRATSFGERVKVVRVMSNAAATQEADTLRIMTWNIAHGRGTAESNWSQGAEPKVRRILEIARLIREQQADIVVLNEVDFSATWSGGFDQARAIAEAAGFPWYARQCNLDFGFVFGRFQFGNVVMSRFPIREAQAIDLPPCSVWEDWLVGRKRGLLCTVDPGGPEISVMGLHLEARGEPIRVQAANYLVKEISKIDRPLVLAGDLNTTPPWAPGVQQKYSPQGYHLTENAFEVLVDQSGLRPLPASIDDKSQFTFPSTHPASTIDWVFYDETAFRARSHRVLQTELSDHLPVVVDLVRGNNAR